VSLIFSTGPIIVSPVSHSSINATSHRFRGHTPLLWGFDGGHCSGSCSRRVKSDHFGADQENFPNGSEPTVEFQIRRP